jgi:hypothetical protein
MFGLNCVIHMRALLKLSLHVEIRITDSTRRSCGPLAYSGNERAKQLLYALDDSV